jgi:hypothetical protein
MVSSNHGNFTNPVQSDCVTLFFQILLRGGGGMTTTTDF